MVYEHGRLMWVFRVIASKNGVLYEVLLLRIYNSHMQEENFGDGKIVKYFIVERGNSGRTKKRPAINMQDFEKLMAIDGLSSKHDNLVGAIFEKVFSLGFVVGVENKLLAKRISLNEFTDSLVKIIEAYNFSVHSAKKVLRNIYRCGVWCGERW